MEARVPALGLLVCLGSIASAAQGPMYSLTVLPNPPGHFHAAGYSINNSGVVAGESSPSTGGKYAASWSPSGPVLLPHWPGATSSEAAAINSLGEIVGRSQGPLGPMAVLWSSGGISNLGSLGGSIVWANSINERSQVVGVSTTASGETHAFLWSRSTGMIDLGPAVGSPSQASDINNAGSVVGNTTSEPFLWRPGMGVTTLGTLNGHRLVASAINNRGQIAGTVLLLPGLERRGFVWADGVLSDLGSLAGQTYLSDINDSGIAVGTDDAAHAAVAWIDGAMLDLNTVTVLPPGSRLWHAWSVNEAGQIAGKGIFGTTAHAFVLTPIPAPSVAVCLGIFALGCRRVRTAADPATR